MASDQDEKAGKLKQACDQAYAMFPASCSHSVWHVISQYNPSHPYMQANQLINYIGVSGQWQSVKLYELSRLASEGVLIVGGLKGSPNGHVIVIYPGPEKLSGGFSVRRSAGKTAKIASDGSYARAMSTSMGSWPGAKVFLYWFIDLFS